MTRRKAAPQPNSQDGVLVESLSAQNIDLSERLSALEFALESLDWRMLTSQAEQEFSREGLRIITELARVMYLKNPIIQRGVSVQRLYVWGQGVSISCRQPEIQAVIDAFNSDSKNQVELTSHQARMQKEIEQQTDGNTFFVLFVNELTGAVRVRTIPFEEIGDVVCDPQDAKSPRYYVRRWSQTTFDERTGATSVESRAAYYPDWRYTPVNKPGTINGNPVMWSSPVYHLKTGGFSGWKFGVSEIYAAIDWARAYKEFLEDWASIVRAYRKFAFQLTTPGGKSGIAAAKAKLGTTVGASSGETNPSPVTGSTFIAGEGVNLTPVRTSGATVSAEDGRRLLLMVAAATGLPETFFGDVSVGTLATANSLDRPTELMMRDRQSLWADVLRAIYQFVLLWQVKAVNGALRGLAAVERRVDGDEVVETVRWNEDVEAHIDIDFPPIVAGNTLSQVQAIVEGATLGGRTPVALDLPTLTRMILVALGQDDVDEIVNRLYPDGKVIEPPVQSGERPQAEAMMVEAVRELRNALSNLRG